MLLSEIFVDCPFGDMLPIFSEKFIYSDTEVMEGEVSAACRAEISDSHVVTLL